MSIRHAKSQDHAYIVRVVDKWWGGRAMSSMLPKLFFEHFQTTSFVMEIEDHIIAFLVGFVSQTDPKQAYIHFVGVDPNERARGLGRALYEHFFHVVQSLGCASVTCVTSPVNSGSIAFHRHLGFDVVPGNAEQNNTFVHTDYDGLGKSRIIFQRSLKGLQ